MINFARLMMFVFSGAIAFLASGTAADAKTIVKVTLWDKGETSMDMIDTMVPMGMAVDGATMDMATMGISVNLAEIPAGEVSFQVVNDSKEFYHAVVVSLVEDPSKALPYLIDKMMVDEDAAGRIAVVKDLKPHASGFVTVDLKPGTYILYCNIAGHYMMGMWTLVTVIE